MIAFVSCALLASVASQEPTPDPQRQEVTVPVDRAVEEDLATALEFLQLEQDEAAVAILQRILETDAATLVPSLEDSNLLVGASVIAHALLGDLDHEAQRQRDDFVARVAEQSLAEALDPPDRQALQELAAHYVGSTVGDRAALALKDLALDRGFSLASEGGGVLAAPWVDSLEDPDLPLVESRGLRPMWRFDFRDPSIAQTSRGHRMTFGDGIGYLTNGVEVAAVRLGDGMVLWKFEGPPGWKDLTQGEFQELIAGENEDYLTIPVLVDGILLVVLRESYGIGRTDKFERRRGWNNIDVRRKLPARRLYAFDASNGHMLWRTDPH
ncbi:MAG: hypothetical protein MK209_02250 [Planctomycetes bacterium]|nr:hypothetical protein [Planctomycetota bacterium]